MNTEWFPYHNQPLQKLVQQLVSVPDEILHWVPAGGRNSIWWILEHLVGSEDFWIHELVYDKSILAISPLHLRSIAGLLDQYQLVRAETDRRLDECTAADLSRVVEVPVFGDGWSPGVTPTVHWVFHHVFEHEMYHIGQISQLLRFQGQPSLPF